MGTQDELRAAILRRLDELRPLIAELEALERALAAIDGEPAEMSEPAGRRKAEGPQRLSLAERQEQVLDVLRADPGIAVAEIGRRIGVSRVRADQIVRRLVSDGRLKRARSGELRVT